MMPGLHCLRPVASHDLPNIKTFGVRAIGGWSEGVLPPQRQFAVGGLGSVHGYDFKEQIGDTLALINLKYSFGSRGGLKAIGFFDAGRATRPPDSRDSSCRAPARRG